MAPAAPPVLPACPLAAAWWRQHQLADRIDAFRACRQPTPTHVPLETFVDETPPSTSNSIAAAAGSLCCSPTTPSSAGVPRSGGLHSSLPVLLVSACLLSCPVTYRGARVRRPASLRPTPLLFLTEVLVKELNLVQCVPVCPEMQWLGLPAPRAPLRLVRAPGDHTGAEALRCVVDSAAEDTVLLRYGTATGMMAAQAAATAAPQLRARFVSRLLQCADAVDGVVLKSYSPSCGVNDARLYEAAPVPPAPLPSAVGRRPVTPTRAGRPFDLVDGFFTHLLRNHIVSAQGRRDDVGAGGYSRAEAPVPVLTCDRLLTHFYADEDPEGSIGPGATDTELTSLDAFMGSVLRHRDTRLSKTRGV